MEYQVGTSGWLVAGAQTPSVCQSPSENCEVWPDNSEVRFLVIHSISLPRGQYGGNLVEQLFTGTLPPQDNEEMDALRLTKVSVHLFIRRNGQLVQFVPLDKMAWHAGQSAWANVENLNSSSIGIELEGTDEDTFTDAQYAVLQAATQAIQEHFPRITRGHILGHRRHSARAQGRPR